MKQSYSVVVVDDHPIFRAGLKSVLSGIADIQVIGEASDGIEGLKLINQLKPDFSLLDIDMPKMDGAELALYIEANAISTKIIFITAHTDAVTFLRATEANNASFLFKESAINEIEHCIKQMILGKTYISPFCQKFITKFREKNQKQIKTIEQLKALTQTEQRILTLIAQQKTTKEIADTLFNSYKTIENHRSNICQKLGISGSNNLLLFCIENREIIERLSSI